MAEKKIVARSRIKIKGSNDREMRMYTKSEAIIPQDALIIINGGYVVCNAELVQTAPGHGVLTLEIPVEDVLIYG